MSAKEATRIVRVVAARAVMTAVFGNFMPDTDPSITLVQSNVHHALLPLLSVGGAEQEVS